MLGWERKSIKDYHKILKYLFDNDTGEFLDVTKAFRSNEQPNKERIIQIFEDSEEYIKTEYSYFGPGPLSLDDTFPEQNLKLPKAKITQVGREYYSEQKNKNISTTLSKRNFIIDVITVILAFLTLLLTIIKLL